MVSRDFIILFTDGEANVGITESYKLVDEYRRKEKKAGFTQHIPISAITIGGYQPLLLQQVQTNFLQCSFSNCISSKMAILCSYSIISI